MLTGLLVATLMGIGGGSDSVEPSYLDDVIFSSDVPRASEASETVHGHVETYMDNFDMSWREAYTWYLGEDNRDFGLLDVEQNFAHIYEGFSVLDGDVVVWVSGPAKSGGIVELLAAYEVDADVELLPEHAKPDQVAYSFITGYGCDDYFAAELNEDETGVVVLASSQYAADAGPDRFGTIIDGVPVDYRYSE